MHMNVKPIPTLDPRINEIRGLTAQIVNRDILPSEQKLWAAWRDGATDEERRGARELGESIKEKVKQAGLWAPHLPPEYGGAGLGFLEHAYMNEVLAYSMGAAALFGVVAPNSGNQTILLKYGTEEQKRKWLIPLTEGKMESGFSMTEPDSAGSDPRSIKTTARRDGDQWVINGHKWFTSNGFRADFLIVMCRTEGSGHDNGRMTQIIVPKDTPGLRIVRGIEVWGRPERPLRDRLRRRACAAEQPAWPDRFGPSGCTGSSGRRARLSLHELDRADVAGVRPDGRAGDDARGAWRQARHQAVHPGLHR